MAHQVSDFGSNVNENLEHWAKILGRSARRRLVFSTIYGGKKRRWMAEELIARTRLDRVAVLHEGKRLAANGLLHEEKVNGRVVYSKDDRVHQHKRRIVRLADSRAAREALPTKRRPRVLAVSTLPVRVMPQRARAKQITIDHIESFSKAHAIEPSAYISSSISETQFRFGIKRILGELGHFTDWPGEQNDLFSTRVRISGKRLATAFAFKGPGTRGILTPAKCGRNGDQIQRLFESPAAVFLFQYHGQIGERVIAEMRAHAMLRSMYTHEEVLYGVIDGQDSERVRAAYTAAFRQ